MRATTKPLVSIVTPVYNSAKYLEATLQSVQGQEYENWEHILVDDQSKDASLKILEEWSRNDKRYRIYKNEVNSGSGVARNLAISKAKGKYIAFLDADDLWHPQKLKLHVQYMIENKALFSHTSYGYIDDKGQKIKDTFHVSQQPVSYTDLLKRTEISCLTAMYDAEELGKYFMSEHRRKQDYALWLSILRDGHKSYGLDEELAYYRQHKDSATSNKLSLVKKHFYFLRETQDFGLFSSLYYTFYWLVNGFIRYYLK